MAESRFFRLRSLLSVLLLWSSVQGDFVGPDAHAEQYESLAPRQLVAIAQPLQYGLIFGGTVLSSGRYAISIDAYTQPITSGSLSNCSLSICASTQPCASARQLTTSWTTIRMTAYFYVNSSIQDFVFNVTCYTPTYIGYRNVVVPGQQVAPAASTLVRTVQIPQATLTVSLPAATNYITLVSSVELERTTTQRLPASTETLTTLSFFERVSTFDRITTIDSPPATMPLVLPGQTIVTTLELPQATTSLFGPTATTSIVETTTQAPSTQTISITETQISSYFETETTSLFRSTATLSLTRTLDQSTATLSITQTTLQVSSVTLTLPASTLVTTLPGSFITSTLLASTQIITRDQSTATLTLPPSTITTTQPCATQTLIVGVEPVCPDAAGKTYALSDGSTFLVNCRRDTIGYDRSLIIGIPELTGVSSFLACLYLCMQQGTACMGVDWDNNAGTCGLRYGTAPYGGPYAYSAMRVTGPTNGPPASQIIVNGGFDNGLTSWSAAPNALSLQNGAGSINMQPDSSGFSQVSVRQSLSGAVAGQSWYLTFYLDFPPGDTHCSFNIIFSDLYYTSWDFGGAGVPYSGLLNASGIFQTPPTVFQLQFTCFGSPQISIAIDDVSLYVYSQSVGASSIALAPVEALQNNDFTSNLYRWVDYRFFSFQAVNGRAEVTPRDTHAVTLTQSIRTAVGENVHLQADVDFSIASGDTCTASITSRFSSEVFWTKQASAAETAHVDQQLTLGSAIQAIELTVTCAAAIASTLAFDNVYFTLNAF